MEQELRREPVYSEILRDYQDAARRYRDNPSIGAQAFWEVRYAALEEALERPGRFELGQVVWTEGAADAMHRGYHVPQEFLIRHKNLDFGDLDVEDRAANLSSIVRQGMVFSRYETRYGDSLFVITSSGWHETCLLRPEES